jgi:hypothetical protein
MMATLEDLQAPVAAQADYRAVVLAAVNALGVNQRGHALGLAEAEFRLGTVQTEMAAFVWKAVPHFARSMSSSRRSRT